MKLTESKLRTIIREELQRLTEAGGELEVYAMTNPDPKYGGAEYIDVLAKRTGSGVEVLDMAGPPGNPIKAPNVMQYADSMARDIEQGDYLEKLPYDRREIEDRFGV